MEITLAHGSGGAATGELIRTVFAKAFDNPILRQMDDSAVVPGSGQLAGVALMDARSIAATAANKGVLKPATEFDATLGK